MVKGGWGVGGDSLDLIKPVGTVARAVVVGAGLAEVRNQILRVGVRSGLHRLRGLDRQNRPLPVGVDCGSSS